MERESCKAATPAGRPRSETCKLRLLETAYRLMLTEPLLAISSQQIAREANVSTATLYRWWSAKEALLLDAYLNAVCHGEVAADEDERPSDRFRNHCLRLGGLLEGEGGRLAIRLLVAIQEDEALRTAFYERLLLPAFGRSAEIAREAVARGELSSTLDVQLFMDMMFGYLLSKLLVRREQLGPKDTERAFDYLIGLTKSTVHAKRAEP